MSQTKFNITTLNYKAIIIIGVLLSSGASLIVGFYWSNALNEIENEEANNKAYDLGYEYGFGNGSLLYYGYGYSNGSADTYSEAYAEGYEQGYNDAYAILENNYASLNVTISPDFFVNVTNDSGNILNDTTWDLRKLGSTFIYIDLETTNLLYDYCDENPTDTVNLTDATELHNKLGINVTSMGMSLMTFSDSLFLFDSSHPNYRTLIGETFVLALNKAILPTFNLFIYANGTIFNGSEYTEDDDTVAFGFCFLDFIPFIMSGMNVNSTILEDTHIFRTFNQNELVIESLTLDVDAEIYEVTCSLNGEEVEILSTILF